VTPSTDGSANISALIAVGKSRDMQFVVSVVCLESHTRQDCIFKSRLSGTFTFSMQQADFDSRVAVAYIDIKSAFDSVDRVALWNIVVKNVFYVFYFSIKNMFFNVFYSVYVFYF